MTTRTEELAAKARKAAEKTAAQKAAEPARPAAPVHTPRTAKVRRTVDLTAHQHDQLNVWCNDAARELGRARVAGQDVLRALIKRLLADEALAADVRADLAEPQ